MRDILPANGASARNIPDPQEREPEVLGVCASCRATLYSGDEVLIDGGGLYFCDEYCLTEWLYDEWLLSKIVLWSDGNVIVRGVG